MSSLKKIDSKKGVIFDLDDTIANTKPAKNEGLRVVSLKICNYFFKKKGIKLDFKKLYKKIGVITEKMVKKGVDNRNVWWEFIIKRSFKENLQKSFLNELTKNYWDAVLEKGILYKEVLSILDYLKKKKYKLGLLSDSDGLRGFKSKRIAALNLEKWFDSIVVAGEETRQIKPDKTPFFLIAKKLNLKPKQCVFIGNDPYRDILGAKRAGGMTTVLIKRDDCKAKIKPDRVIKTLNELKNLL